ncbi:MAG: hypothetical protein ACFFDS_03395, partial [Candidatus Thorarchaeota archaeon]
MKGIFRNERIKELENNRTPVKFLENAKIVLHIIPEESTKIDKLYNIEIITRSPSRLEPIKSMGIESSHTFDGFLTYTEDLSGVARSYVHLYKSGIIEAVEGSILKPIVERYEIPSVDFEKEIIEAFPSYVQVLKTLDVKTPITLFLTLVNVKGYVLKLNKEILGANPTPIEEDILKLQDIFVEDYDDFIIIPRLLQPWFDEIWQACGLFKS